MTSPPPSVDVTAPVLPLCQTPRRPLRAELDDGERAPRRERVVLRIESPQTSSCVRRSRRRQSACVIVTTTPDSAGAITLACCRSCQPPRRLNQSQHDGREAPPSRERVVDPDRAADFAERAPIAVRASRVRPQPPRRARRRSPRAQLAAAPHVTAPAQSEPTRRPRERRRAASESSTLIARRGPRRSCADLVLPGVRYLSPSRRSRPCRTPLHTAPAAVLLLCQPPRRLPRADTATASERRAASTSLLRPSAADLVVRAPVSSSENARVS